MDESKYKNKDLNKKNYEELKYDYNLRMTSGVLLLINCPAQMQFGIDSSKWKIGDKFMGIKLIPEGAHYVSYALSSEEYAIKQGFFIYVNNKKLIHIRKWDNDLEDFVALKEEDYKNFSIGVHNLEFDPYLGNYPLEQYENWKDLCKYISYEVIERIQPLSKKYITSSKEYDEISDSTNMNLLNPKSKKFEEMLKLKNPETYNESNQKLFEDKSKDNKQSEHRINLEDEIYDSNQKEDKKQTESKDKIDESNQPEQKNKPDYSEMQENIKKSLTNFDKIKSDLYFTDIPKKKVFLVTEKIEKSLITKNNIDKSFLFEELLIKSFKGNEEELLGEFQFSFITFLIAEIYESFEHWKNLCILILNCQDAISKKTKFFCLFIEVLYNQFRQFPKDFFIDELTSNNFFNKSLENFIVFIKDEENKEKFSDNNKIKKMIIYFEKFLDEYFGLHIKDENTKIIEKYLDSKNINSYDHKTLKNKEEEDDEMPVIVYQEEINQILEYGNDALNNMQIETDTTVNNTDTEQEDNDNMNIDRF